MDDEATLRTVNEGFYKALETLDLAAMERIWLHESWVRCVHPGWDVLVGWTQVRESFEQIIASTRWIRVQPTNVDIKVFGDVAIVATAENITATSDGDVGVATAQATNIYLRTPDGWRMINHHASPAPVHVTQPFSGTIQ